MKQCNSQIKRKLKRIHLVKNEVQYDMRMALRKSGVIKTIWLHILDNSLEYL